MLPWSNASRIQVEVSHSVICSSVRQDQYRVAWKIAFIISFFRLNLGCDKDRRWKLMNANNSQKNPELVFQNVAICIGTINITTSGLDIA